jgi:hypothetical protein
MIAEITITAKKIYKVEYPDNDFSDAVIIDNFWNQTYDQDEFMEKSKITVRRLLR